MKWSIITFIIISSIIMLTILLIVYLCCRKNQEHFKNSENTIHIYNKASKQIFTLLNNIGVEWWPTEGTLIGMLRWGSNFGKIDEGIIATDGDIDIMIRVKDENNWTNLKNFIKKELSKDSMWTKFSEYNHNIGVNRKPKFTCYTDYRFGLKCHHDTIHIDIHSYMVDERLNIAYMDPLCRNNPSLCKKKYPFQNWGGVAPYRGLIVDKNGKFRKVKFEDMVLKCPYKPLEIISKWNGHEYGNGKGLNLPVGNCVLRGKQWEGGTVHGLGKSVYSLTDKDKEKLYNISKELDDQNFMSFIDHYKNLTCDVVIPCIPVHIKFLRNTIKDLSNQNKLPNNIIIALSETEYSKAKQIERELRKIFPRTFIYSTKEIQKSWENRDRGVSYSNADVICLLDADDRIHQQRISSAMRKFNFDDIEFLLCEGTQNKLEFIKNYDINSFDTISGSKIFNDEIKKYNNFDITIRHFNVPIKYNNGVPFILRKLWWNVGGQTKNVINNPEVIRKNGIGEDIIFSRYVLKNMKDRTKFVIMKNPTLLKLASESRKENQWIKRIEWKDRTLPEIKKRITYLIKKYSN